MTDREKQIEEMTEIIKADYKEWLDITGCLPKGTSYYYECLGGAGDCAKKLYDNGYRKMDEITLKLDLGDRSAEEIQQIAEAFANEPTTAILAPSNESEIRKQVAKDILQTLHYEIDREKGAGTIYGDFNYGLDIALNKVENIAEDYGVEIDK